MLVIFTEQQILSTKQVCGSCLMADSGGLPRWRKGKLCCGRLINERQNNNSDRDNIRCEKDLALQDLGRIYECQMGFRVTKIA